MLPSFPLEQLFFFTGGNIYLLRQQSLRWVQEFTRKHGAENLLRIAGAETNFRSLTDEVAVAPFIAERRLVIVEGVPKGGKEEGTPKSGKEEVVRFIAAMHPQVVVLFVDPSPDRRLSAVKELLAKATVREWKPLSPAQIRLWVSAFARDHGGEMTETAVGSLIERVGADQELLAPEIEKLVCYAKGRPITQEDVDVLAVCSVEREVWGLMPLLKRGGEAAALSYVHALLARGESIQGLWSMFLWMTGNFLPLSLAARRGGANPAALAKATGMKPGTVLSLLPVVRQHSLASLGAILARIVDYDIALKTGEIRATDQEPQELEAALDCAIVACCA